MVHNLAGAGHENVVAMGEEGLDGLVLGHGVAEVFQIDGGGALGPRARWMRDVTAGALGLGRADLTAPRSARARIRRKRCSARAGVFHVLALGQLVQVDGGSSPMSASRSASALGQFRRSGAAVAGRPAECGGVVAAGLRGAAAGGRGGATEVAVELIAADDDNEGKQPATM